MTTIGLLAAVTVQVASYGGGVTFDGGSLEVRTYLPGWSGSAPKTAYALTSDWKQDEAGVHGEYRMRFTRDVDLQCAGLVFHVDAAATSGRAWGADGKFRTVPEKMDGTGFGSGEATRFTVPLANGKTIVAAFPAPTPYRAQDGRKWGKDWFIRFGRALERTTHKAGEELVYQVTFTSPEGIELKRGEPCKMQAGGNWFRFENKKDILPGSALDFAGQGLQDAPAGKYGWLKAVGGQFVFAEKPDVAQRFYGVNFCGTANYPEHADADRIVERLLRLGYNTIRIHHHDETWAKFPEKREKLDYLIARAIARGLYVTTDLYVSRKVSWKELGEDRPGGPDVQLFKTLVEIDEAAYANWAAFAREFLEHVNPYTGRAYKDEPGLPLISLINEGTLGMGFGYAEKAKNPKLLTAWRAFSGKSDARAIPNPWTDKTVQAFDDTLNRRFFIKASAFLRGLGVKALLTNDNNGSRHGDGEGVTPLYDYVDNHFYIDHPEFLEKRWSLPSKCPNENPVRLGQPKLFTKGYAKGASKPYAITEWNFSGPGRYRALGGILTGAYAARDGWDALWRFAYSHNRDNWKDGDRQSPGYFDCAIDPLLQASDRASICLFLRGDANEGTVMTDEKEGLMAFVSARTVGGFVEAGRLAAGPLVADVSGAPAAVWVSALDGKPVSASQRLLLVHLTDVQGDGAVYADASRKILLKWGRGCLVEKGEAKVSLVHPGRLRLHALDTTGRRVKELPTLREGDNLVFTCTTAAGTLYYELSAPRNIGVRRENPATD